MENINEMCGHNS